MLMHHHTKFDRSEILSGQTFTEVQNFQYDPDQRCCRRRVPSAGHPAPAALPLREARPTPTCLSLPGKVKIKQSNDCAAGKLYEIGGSIMRELSRSEQGEVKFT